jgi:hypothetical protein
MRLKYTLDACMDCVAYAASGTLPEDRPELASDIIANLGDDARHLVNADGYDKNGNFYRDSAGAEIDCGHPDYESMREDWFSWSPCECCGNPLGGNRNRLAVLSA